MPTPDPRRCHVLVVEPNLSGGTLVRAAKQAGLRTVIATHDADDRRMPDDLRAIVDDVVVVDTNDDTALHDVALKVHERTPLAAVMAGFEIYVPVVAALAADLGLPGLPAAAVPAVRDKAVMRERIEHAGLR